MPPSTQSSATKQVAMECDAPFLPGEIIRNILKRLPVRTLIRFQCVCKDWKNLFKTPSFIEDHLHCCQNPSLLFHGHPLRNPLELYMLDREMQVIGAQSAPSIEHLLGAKIIGCINGLLCVRLDKAVDSILLWNPAIRKVRLVPRAVNYAESFKMGFGFSSIVNDYKIVSINHFWLYKERVYRVDVYSFSTWSWKNIEFGNFFDGISIKSDGFSTNEAIFWIGFKAEDDAQLLISYNIATEVFTLIPSPISAPKFHYSVLNRIIVHENKLAMFSHTTTGNLESSLIDLWVMEEDGTSTTGERWGWTKKYSIRHPNLLVPGIVFGNIIICLSYVLQEGSTASELDGRQNIVTVNLTTHELKRFASLKYSMGFGIYNYVESLMPVGNSDIEEH